MKTNYPVTGNHHRVLAAVLVAGAFLACPAFGGSKADAVKPAYGAITVLGDSLSDTGRAGAVLGDAAPVSMVNGRLSNGPLWIEYVSPALGVAYDATNNFSWAGGYTGYGNAFTGLPGLSDELEELLEPFGAKRHLPKDALYVVFGGANDFFKILNGANPYEVVPEAIEHLRTILTVLHERGVKHIVVMDVPDLGLTPRARLSGPAAAAELTALCLAFNGLLEEVLQDLGFTVVRVSTFSLLRAVVDHPAAYGFTNTTDLGILDPAQSDTFVFWDDIHPTTRLHALLAERVLRAIEETVSQPGIHWRGAQGFYWSRIGTPRG